MSLIDQKFKNHYDYYLTLGVETNQQQSGSLQQVSSDYQGRVLYELLQNAFDKSNGKILVELKDNTLYIANDGGKFTYNSVFNYKKGNSKRCDFESLCSIATSTKIDAASIGNKGVGFKSVFSVSSEGYVKIHTKGLIQNEEETIEEEISFLVYDVFTQTSSINSDYPKVIKEYLEENIAAVQSERAERGVPGYYFPLLLKNKDENIQQLYNNGYVTVIEIPFNDEQLIRNLIDEIKQIHFKFVSLKHKKKFAIQFNLEDDSFIKSISPKDKGLISVEIEKDKIAELAKQAGVTISENNYVGIYFREEANGLLYNYLPTQKPSPFPFIDFHADFHTTVDRRSIDFSKTTAIGKYNTLLLEACIELLFITLCSQVDDITVESLNLRIIDAVKIPKKQLAFNWRILDFDNTNICRQKIRDLFSVDDDYLNQYNYKDRRRYLNVVTFLSKLSKAYFDEARDSDEYDVYYKCLKVLINQLTDDYNKVYSRSKTFKYELAIQLMELDVKILPNSDFKRDDEVFFKQKENETVQLPSFLGVKVTNFVIEDEGLRRALGIKEYSDSYPILRYFRQVSINGEISSDSITEKQQIELLQSLYEFFKNRNANISFTHRYENFISDKSRADSSPQNNANFSVSTLFLKVNTGKYKPAQLCTLDELDKEFLLKINIEKQDLFLKFLGVSSVDKYLVVEKTIYDKFREGIDYIPMTIEREKTDILTGEKILPQIRVISNTKEIHPALINYNRYPFLDDISNKNIREQLHSLKIGNYYDFPRTYVTILLDRLQEAILNYPSHVVRLYSYNLFDLFHRQKKYIVSKNGNYEITSSTDFLIASNKEEYELLASKSITLLCHFNANEISEPHFQDKKVKLKLSSVETEGETKFITSLFIEKIYPYVPFLLIEISKMEYNISERNYLLNSHEIQKFKEFLTKIEIVESDKIAAIWNFDEKDICIEKPEPFQWDPKENKIYIERNISDKLFANLIAKHIFNLSALSDKIELFFGKDVTEIVKDYDKLDVEQINKFWIPDYLEKFKSFQKEILDLFSGFKTDNKQLWFLYNEHNQSDFLISLNNSGLIPMLQQQIKEVKAQEAYQEYFKDFELEISRKHIEKRVGKLKTILKINDVNSPLLFELENLESKLGIEKRISEIELEISSLFPNTENGILETETKKAQQEINIKNKVNSIYQKFLLENVKETTKLDLTGEELSQVQLTRKKKVIYKGNNKLAIETELAAMGATGEEEVLIYFISKFIEIEDVEKRIIGINAVHSLIQSVTASDKLFDTLKDNCLSVIENDEELRRALIPFFYITLHFKFSNFDLVAFDEGQAVLVEVKTTDKMSFIMSISEVLRARSDDNYIIVRVTSDAIEILGNPVKQFEGYINEVRGKNISMKPRNYEVTIANQ